ncbi:MAG: AraC family transcriptional regulator ligand-binding domain-containing protein [Rhizobiaceae bacterium]
MSTESPDRHSNEFWDRTTWVKYALEFAGELGANSEDILAETNLRWVDLEHEDQIPAVKSAEIFEVCARTTGNDLFGLQLLDRVDLRDVGLLWYLALNSPNLRSCVKNIRRYYQLYQNFARITVSDETLSNTFPYTIVIAEHSELLPSQSYQQFEEFNWLGFLLACRRLTNSEIAPVEVGLRYLRSNNVKAIEQYCKCSVEFGAPANYIRLTEDQYLLPIPTSDNKLLSILEVHAKDLLENQKKAVPNFEHQVTKLVVEQLPRGKAKAKIIAKEMAVSERTLARRLSEFETSFGSIIDDVRKNLFARYIREEELSLSQIAYLLGYSEQAAMTKSVKRWTGETPRKYLDRVKN